MLAPAPAPAFDFADFLARARSRLSLALPADPFDPVHGPGGGDFAFADLTHDPAFAAAARKACVLIGIVPRGATGHVILTLRAAALRDHSGQVAFPGGKIDESDAGPLDAALREAREEIGLAPAFVTPLGWLAPYLTGTGFRVLPLVALVDPAYSLTLDAREVDEAFETPLDFLMDPANHRRGSREWKGVMRRYIEMPWQGRHIWGATAGMIRALHDRIYL